MSGAPAGKKSDSKCNPCVFIPIMLIPMKIAKARLNVTIM